MLYTIGNRLAYDLHVNKPHFKKLGRSNSDGPFYAGGIVFLTIRLSEVHIQNQQAVELYQAYGLDTNLDNTYVYTDGTRRLIKACRIITAK